MTLRMMSQIDRRADLDLARFSTHWRTTHRQHALALVPAGIMLGYVQNHRVEAVIPGLEPPCDGAPELWVDSADAVARLSASRAYTEGAALDEPNFMSGSARTFLSQAVDRSGDLDRFAAVGYPKLLLFYRIIPGVAREDVATRWHRHGLTLSACAGVCRAELYIGIGAAPDGSTPCSEAIWWHSEPDFRRAWTEYADRISTIVDRQSLSGMLVDELPVLWPVKNQKVRAGENNDIFRG